MTNWGCEERRYKKNWPQYFTNRLKFLVSDGLILKKEKSEDLFTNFQMGFECIIYCLDDN